MTHFRGYVAFETETLTQQDRARAGAAFFDAGLGKPKTWSDDVAALGLAQRFITNEDLRERQPIADSAGRVVLFSGYLFEPAQVRADLGISPESTDSEIISGWVERYGFENLQRLKGDYTFAVWDPQKRKIDLVVSAMAMRIVYWHSRPNGFWFATILSALHQFPGVPKVLDPLELAMNFSVHIADPAKTHYKDVRLVPPGTHLSVTQHGVQERAFWRPDASRRVTFRKPEDYAEAALELLDRSVKLRLRGRRTPGVLVSGGLDSPAVAASAAIQSAPGEVQTYTAIPHPGQYIEGRKGWYNSEQASVEALAAQYPNIRPGFYSSAGPAGFEEDPTPFFVAGGRNFFGGNHFGWFDPTYRAARADGHDVVLMGSMGNMALSFDGLRTMSDFARSGRIDKLLTLAIPAIRFIGRSLKDIMKYHILLTALPPKLRDTQWRLRHPGQEPWARTTAMRPEFGKKIGFNEALWAAGEDGMFLHQAKSRDLQANFLHNRRTRNLEMWLALRAYYGLEQRDPYADADLVDFCIGIPRDQYLWGGQTRSLMRRTLANRLPARIVNERNIGQQNPEWFARISAQRESFAAEVERLASVPLAADMLDLPRLKAMLDNWPKDADAAKARRFEFEHMLPRAIQTGRFIRWSEGGNQ